MAEVLVEFSEPVISQDGRAFVARACGAEMEGTRWQGWIEFEPVEGGAVVRSGRETTQPNRTDTAYWATGLTPVYLEGALQRALTPTLRTTTAPSPSAHFDSPAPSRVDPVPVRESVLNPFSVFRKGDGPLRNRLAALSGWHLVNIIEAYGLSESATADLEATPPAVLIELIVSAVQKRSLTGAAAKPPAD